GKSPRHSCRRPFRGIFTPSLVERRRLRPFKLGQGIKPSGGHIYPTTFISTHPSSPHYEDLPDSFCCHHFSECLYNCGCACEVRYLPRLREYGRAVGRGMPGET
ncbi:hypothetical protein PAXRUDRAFT_781612, partial [Paxillus rubicundulus Ve08.2h10]